MTKYDNKENQTESHFHQSFQKADIKTFIS